MVGISHCHLSTNIIQVLFWTLFNVAFRRNKDVNPTRKVCMVQFTVSSLDRLPLLYTWWCAWVHGRGVCGGVTVCYTGHIIRYSIHQTYTEEHHVICLLKLSGNYLTENSLAKAHVLCRLTCHNLMLSPAQVPGIQSFTNMGNYCSNKPNIDRVLSVTSRIVFPFHTLILRKLLTIHI